MSKGTVSIKCPRPGGLFCDMTRGGILGIKSVEILLISSSTLPGLGRVSAKNVNKLTDFNAAVSNP